VEQDEVCVGTFVRILFQDEVDEAAYLGRTHYHFEVHRDYPAQLLLAGDAEGVAVGEDFVGQCAERPTVDFLVVFLAL
jgi:hypothetical protein